MYHFTYSIPTKIAFGEGEIQNLPKFVKEYGQKVLIVYGGGSIKRIGIYDTLLKILNQNGIEHEELEGVEPNPQISTVRKGVALCREKNIDVVLPVGGGSSIDCAKAVAAAYYYEGDPWDIVEKAIPIKKALPIIAVLTLAATGSEMDGIAVISNDATQDKMAIASPELTPKYSVLDPTYTYSVPTYQTASGTADIMSHVFEVYFNGRKPLEIQKGMMESILKTCIQYGPVACKEPDNYEARANLMWASSWAINGFISNGIEAPWPCHAMEHQLSAYYDVTHGHGLAILTPVWMEYILNDNTVEMFANYGKTVLGIDACLSEMKIAKLAIKKTKELFHEMGLTDSFSDIGITTDEHFRIMAQKASVGLQHSMFPLNEEDIYNIYSSCR